MADVSGNLTHQMGVAPSMRRTLLTTVILLAVFAASCSTPNDFDPTAASETPTAAPAPSATAEPQPTTTTEPEPTATSAPVRTIAVVDSNLPSLENGRNYVLSVAGDDVATFSDPANAAFDLIIEPPADASIVISLDSAAVAAGTLVGESADLSFAAVVGTDFSDAAGQYILATPTDGTTGGVNERSGVWWTLIPRSQSLFLPVLPAGWVYEGWAVIDGEPVTSGTFTEPFGSPDNAAPFSGDEPGPPLVGEDYLVNAPEGLTFPVDLRDRVVAISIEPAADTDPAPFPAIVLRGIVPGDAIDHVPYEVDNVASGLPHASVAVTMGQ